MRRRDMLVIALAAFALYFSTVFWGLPYATAPDRIKTVATDEILPLEPLAEMRSTFLETAPDRNYGYPWWHYFTLASAQAPYVAYLLVSGRMDTPSPLYPFGLADPVAALRWLTVIGRLVSVLMGVGVVIAAYLLGATLWGRATALVGASLTTVGYLMVHYAGTGNLDVPCTFWTALGVLAMARILERKLTVRRAVWLGVFAALAMATKDQALVFFLPFGLLLLLPAFQGPAARGPYPLRALLLGLGASIAVYAAATGMLVDPARHLEHVRRMLLAPETLSVASYYHESLPFTPGGVAILLGDYASAARDVWTVPVLLAALWGVVLVARRTPRHLVMLLPVPLLFVMLTLPTGIVVKRYLLPLTPLVDAFAAYGIVWLIARLRQRALATALVVVVFAPRLAVAADLVYAKLNDTRLDAARWLAAHAVAGDRVEHFGPSTKLPPLPAEIRTQRVAGRTEWKGDFDVEPILDQLARHGPRFVVIIPDWTSSPRMERSGDCPEEVYRGLADGSLGYGLGAHFSTPTLLPGVIRRPPLDNPSVAPPVRIFERRERSDG